MIDYQVPITKRQLISKFYQYHLKSRYGGSQRITSGHRCLCCLVLCYCSCHSLSQAMGLNTTTLAIEGTGRRYAQFPSGYKTVMYLASVRCVTAAWSLVSVCWVDRAWLTLRQVQWVHVCLGALMSLASAVQLSFCLWGLRLGYQRAVCVSELLMYCGSNQWND